MKDIISEYILTICEVAAGIGIVYSFAKFAPALMAIMK